MNPYDDLEPDPPVVCMPDKNQRKKKQMTTCALCSQPYCQPRMLPCGNNHTLCIHCIEHLVSVWPPLLEKDEDKPCIFCPLCTGRVDLPDNGVAGFMTNEYVLDGSTSCSTHGERRQLQCLVCSHGHAVLWACAKCGTLLCDHCSYFHGYFRQSHPVSPVPPPRSTSCASKTKFSPTEVPQNLGQNLTFQDHDPLAYKHHPGQLKGFHADAATGGRLPKSVSCPEGLSGSPTYRNVRRAKPDGRVCQSSLSVTPGAQPLTSSKNRTGLGRQHATVFEPRPLPTTHQIAEEEPTMPECNESDSWSDISSTYNNTFPDEDLEDMEKVEIAAYAKISAPKPLGENTAGLLTKPSDAKMVWRKGHMASGICVTNDKFILYGQQLKVKRGNKFSHKAVVFDDKGNMSPMPKPRQITTMAVMDQRLLVLVNDESRLLKICSLERDKLFLVETKVLQYISLHNPVLSKPGPGEQLYVAGIATNGAIDSNNPQIEVYKVLKDKSTRPYRLPVQQPESLLAVDVSSDGRYIALLLRHAEDLTVEVFIKDNHSYVYANGYSFDVGATDQEARGDLCFCALSSTQREVREVLMVADYDRSLVLLLDHKTQCRHLDTMKMDRKPVALTKGRAGRVWVVCHGTTAAGEAESSIVYFCL